MISCPPLFHINFSLMLIATNYEALCMDGVVFSNVSRFLNHRCDSSDLLDMPMRINDKNLYYYHIIFFINTSIESLDELT